MTKYIVGASWIAAWGPRKGMAQWATFGIFSTNAEAIAEMRRLQALPAEMIHFAPASAIEWGISQDLEVSA